MIVERERFRQIRLQNIDALGERLCESGRYRDALRVVLAGMAMDPLRESPHRLMVKAHLRLGTWRMQSASREHTKDCSTKNSECSRPVN